MIIEKFWTRGRQISRNTSIWHEFMLKLSQDFVKNPLTWASSCGRVDVVLGIVPDAKQELVYAPHRF